MTLDVRGSITINAGATLEMNGEDVIVHGNLTIDANEAQFVHGNGTVMFHPHPLTHRDHEEAHEDCLECGVNRALEDFIEMLKRLTHE